MQFIRHVLRECAQPWNQLRRTSRNSTNAHAKKIAASIIEEKSLAFIITTAQKVAIGHIFFIFDILSQFLILRCREKLFLKDSIFLGPEKKLFLKTGGIFEHAPTFFIYLRDRYTLTHFSAWLSNDCMAQSSLQKKTKKKKRWKYCHKPEPVSDI